MGGSQKSKRVSWASDVNLCQVRLFLSEESPSQVGLGTQDHLQAKTQWPDQSGDTGTDYNLPPGFEGIQHANLWRFNLSQAPLVTWRWPPRFEVNSEWAVVAGEESTEIEAQNQREMRVLEAVYPRLSAIPPNPSALMCAEDSIVSDQNTPVVPITPIEEEEAALDNTTFTSEATTTNLTSSHPQHISHSSISSHGSATNGILSTDVEPDVVSAAQAALTSILSNGDQHNLIDRELLLKILSNPKTVEQLLTNHATYSSSQNTPSSGMPNMPSSKFQGQPIIGGQPGTTSSTQLMPSFHTSNLPSYSLQNVPSIGVHNTPSTSTQYTPNLRSPPKNSFDYVNFATDRREPLSTHLSRPEIRSPSMATASTHLSRPEIFSPSMATASIPFCPSIRNVRPSLPDVIMSAPSPGVPLVKDASYYKSLIQQHGEERRESLPQFANQSNQPLGTSQEPIHVAKLKDSKQKIMKPCIFFNSARGCRNGANFPYQHDVSSQQRIGGIPEVQTAKRVKIDREITGT
ncbi:zinc finger CCCH domain-containing protein 6-like isoform X1 [Primulina tabacum]|uniref:zinc finger CCCH domain-containing protein 6-like isoform X1 n=1 Tax=Primulina tabacum TaxID=48773 RepID=UPI003F5A2E09